MTFDLTLYSFGLKEERPHNSTYKKLAVHWLNGALCFYSSSVLVDSFVHRKPPEWKEVAALDMLK